MEIQLMEPCLLEGGTHAYHEWDAGVEKLAARCLWPILEADDRAGEWLLGSANCSEKCIERSSLRTTCALPAVPVCTPDQRVHQALTYGGF
mmetsp:Transcript_44871/g.89622  ORF Transcript_44871/g.89622 Transcript_44871/m.89622 type:complete len:91 (+) Transcript_44871:215-487(+)